MANGRRDVDLVIRARNEASKAIDAVQSALGELLKAQNTVGKSATENGSLLQQLGVELGKLRGQVEGASAMDRLAAGMDNAKQAVDRLEKSVSSAREEQTRLASEMGQAERAVADFEKQSERAAATLAAQKAKTVEAQAAQKQYREELAAAAREQAKAASANERAQKAFEAQTAKFKEITKAQAAAADAVTKADEPTRKQISTYERLTAAFGKQQEKLQAAHKNWLELADASDKADAALEKVQAQGDAVAQRFEKAKAAQTDSAAALKIVQQQAAEAATNLSRLRTAATQNDAALGKQNAALATARDELQKIVASSGEADVALEKIAGTVRQRLLTSLREAQTEMAKYRAQWNAAQASIRASVAGGGDVSNPSPELAGSLLSARASKAAYAELQQAVQRMRSAIRDAGTDVDKLAAAQEAFVGVQKRVQAAVEAATSAEKGAAQAAREMADQQRGAGNSAGEAEVRTRAFANTLKLIEGNGRKSLSFLQRLRGELLSLVASYAGFYAAIQAGEGVVSSFRTLEVAQTQLGVVFDQNTQKVTNELDWIKQLSDRLKLNFKDLAAQYAQFAVSTKGTPLEGGQTRKIFESVAIAARAANLSGEQVEGTFLALSQMVSKGVVSMEELRRQLGDRLPGAFQIAAKSMGITTAQLNKLVSSGQLSSTSFLPHLAEGLIATFGPQVQDSLKTINAEIDQFKNNLFTAQLDVARGGLVESLRTALNDLNTFFKSDNGKKFFAELGKAAGLVVEMLAAIPNHLTAITTVLSVMVGIKASNFLRVFAADFAAAIVRARAMPAAIAASNVAMATGTAEARGLTGALAALRAAFTSMIGSARAGAANVAATVTSFSAARVASGLLAGAIGILRGALAALGGIPGLIITGLTIFLGKWLTSAEDATTALEAHEQEVNKVRQAYANATENAKDWAKTVKDVSANSVILNTRDLQKQLSDLRASKDVADTNGHFFTPDARVGNAFDALTAVAQGFRNGTVKADEFKKKVEEVAVAAPELDKFTKPLLSIADNATKTQKAIDENNAVLRVLEGTATDADRVLLGLSKSIEATGAASKDASQQLADAKTKLESYIPSLKLAAERANALKELESIKLVVDVSGIDKGSAEYKEFLALLERGKKEINQKFDEAQYTRLADRIIAAESGGRANATNPNSTATGVGQFIESTWIRLFKEYFPDRAEGMTREAMLDLRKNAEVSKALVEAYAKENSDILQKAGVSVNDAAVYLAHFLGPQGALKVLQAQGDTPLSSILSQKQINANQSVLGGGKTAADVIAWAEKRVDLTDQQVQLEGQVNRALSTQAATAAEFHTNLKAQLDVAQQQVAPAKQRTMQEEVTAAIIKAQNEARKAGTTLSEEELRTITETTQKKWELKHAEDAINEAKKTQREMDRDLNKAVETRSALYKQYQFAQSQGDTDKAAALKQRYDEVSQTLSEMIQKQIAYWQSVGGPEADIAIAKLQAVAASMANVGKEYLPTAEQINKMTAEGLGGSAVDNFIEKMRQGQGVIESLRDSFLQFASDFLKKIAEMILQQVIFNAIKNSSWGGAVAGLAAGVLHTGGVVGSSAGTKRSVPGSWFATAVRYHTGGIAGLAPNEVPAVLQKGEEVLARNDPRNVLNGGGGVAPAPNIKVVNAIDAGSFVSEGLNTNVGQKAFFNFIRANSGTIKRQLGVS